MRKIEVPSEPVGGTHWLITFDDRSRVVVDVAGSVASQEKSLERIEYAAQVYSDAHPSGVISSVVVDLRGEKLN
jgi:hypothetical protein